MIMASDRYPAFSKAKLLIIVFWFLETIVMRAIPSVSRLVYWSKYNYYKTPRWSIVKLFDNYAENFDEHLIQNLEYHTPSYLAEFIDSNASIATPLNRVLDLGCGTGLLGLALAKQFNIERLIGVDLSWKMLKKSQARAIYNELHNADLLEHLRNNNYTYDLIAAADVFIYIGELKAVMVEIHRLLKPNGYLAFSVERIDNGTFELTSAGRFQHSLNYLHRLSTEVGFSSIKCNAVSLRKEHNVMVPGYLILIAK